MSNRVSDCPPLFEPGEWIRSVDELRELCVKSFPLSTTRWSIMDGFRQIVAMLENESISCELIVDGSYLTEEIQPDDIDFAVVVTPNFYDHCTQQQRKLLDWIGDSKEIVRTHLCDCYLCVNYKDGDAVWFEGINDRSWWVNFFAKSVFFKRDRGVVIVKIGMGVEQ